MTFNMRNMLNSLLFETKDGKWATCSINYITTLLCVNGGDNNDITQFCGDTYVEELTTDYAASQVSNCLGLEHNEDVWCQIHEVIQKYKCRKMKNFKRRQELL